MMQIQPKIILSETTMRLQSPVSDETLLKTVKIWTDLLADLRFQAAFDFTAHDPYYRWTPELMETLIVNYGSVEDDGRHNCRVSKTAISRDGLEPQREIERYADADANGRIAEIWYDLPLDGVWSDLTATFGVHQIGSEQVLVLNDIHVF